MTTKKSKKSKPARARATSNTEPDTALTGIDAGVRIIEIVYGLLSTPGLPQGAVDAADVIVRAVRDLIEASSRPSGRGGCAHG